MHGQAGVQKTWDQMDHQLTVAHQWPGDILLDGCTIDS